MKVLRRISVLAIMMLTFAIGAAAQLTGTKNIPGDYATLTAAITDLNTQGVGAGGVTFNVVAGNPQTAPAGGYVIGGTGSAVLTTSSAANPVIFQGNGNTVTAPAQVSGNLTDAIFKLIGADFVTINGFNMQENAANTTFAAATNNATEFGVALFYVTTTDGAQNNTISNNTIDMTRLYQNSFGIYSNNSTSATSISTSANSVGAAGANSGNKIYTNQITDVNSAIAVIGSAGAAADQNTGLDIGGTSAGQGNTITNFGNTGTFSSFVGVSGTVNAIQVKNTTAVNISFNSITSASGATGVTSGTLRGIYVPSASVQPVGTFTNNFNSNTIALTTNVVAGTVNGIVVEATTTTATSTTNINTNNFTTLNNLAAAASGAGTAISNAGVALVISISSNTFTNLTFASTGSFTFINDTLTAPAGGTKNVNSNSVVTAFNKTGAGGTITFFVDNGSDPGVTNTNNSNSNTFSNVTTAGGTTAIVGIQNTNGGATTKNVNNNTVSNINNTTTSTGSFTGILTGAADGGPTTVSGNTVNTVTSGGTITGMSHGTGAGVRNVTQNTVHTLTGSGTGTVTGILHTGGTATANNVTRNKVYGISNTNAGGSASGITVSGGTTVNVQNNLVGNITAPNLNATNSLFGINITGGTTVNADFNTVYLNATSVGTNFGSSAISAATATTLTLRNNIFVNLSTPNGTGLTVAYRRSSTTLTSYAAASNNNDFFAGTPSATRLIFNDGTNSDQTLAAYKARVTPRDSVSITENPTFVSTNGTDATFLHINTVTPTQLESGGVAIAGITVDYDGDTRNNPPDIGADEFAGTLLDLTGPTITYTALGNTSSPANRTINVTITDPSGVAGGVNAPRIYFRKNGGAYFSTQCTGTAPNYVCTIDNLLIGGVTTGDVINYFVVAQDASPNNNVSANPGAGFAATDVNNVTTPPTNPNAYTIVTAVNGTFNVGTGQTYTSLTNTGGIFDFINNNDVTGNIVINITSDLLAETGTVALNAFTAPNTITIKPNAAPTTISGAAASTALIRLNGASRVTIDGSTAGGTDRSLTISNTSLTAPSVVRFGSVGTTPIVNDTLRNCILINGVNTSSAVTVLDTAGSLGGYFNNITVQNNDVQRAFRGIFFSAIAAGTNGSGTLITANTLNTAGANSIRLNPIFVAGVNGVAVTNNILGNISDANAEVPVGILLSTGTDNAVVSGNTISGIVSTSATTTASASGILVSVGAASTSISVANNTISNITSAGTSASHYGIASFSPNVSITGNTVTGMTQTSTQASFGIVLVGVNNNTVSQNTVSAMMSIAPNVTSGIQVQGVSTNVTFDRNRVFNIKNTNTTGYGANGIQLSSSSATANITTRNNFVYDVAAYGFAGGGVADNGYGIIVTSGAGYNVWNNSVNMNTNQTVDGLPAAFNVTAGVTAVGAINLRNNIFNNSQTVGTDRYAIYSGAANTVFSAIDYNDYFTTGPNLGFIVSNRTTLADIQTGFGGNTNSKNVDPLFVSATDLHLTGASTLTSMGTPIAGVTVDFDGDPRPAANPDIGADEVVMAVGGVFPAGTFYNASFANGNMLGGDVTVTNSLTLNGVTSTGVNNTLTVDCNATVSGAGEGNYVDGNVKKNFCAAGMFSYPVGENGYSPVLVNADVATTFPASLTIDAVDGVLTGLIATNSVTRSWQLTEGGSLSATLAFTYRNEDVQGMADESLYSLYRNPGTLTFVPSMVNPGGNTVTTTAPQTEFSPWGIGFAPTAASVGVGGRVLQSNGRGVFRARVTMSDPQGNVRTAFTNPFGYYHFNDVPAGESYIFTATHLRYQFGQPTQVQFIGEDNDEINFTALDITNLAKPDMPGAEIEIRTIEPKRP